MTEKLKLFVWHDTLTDYTDGVMFALAHDVEEARQAIRDNGGEGLSSVENDLEKEPSVYTDVTGHFVYGGG